MTRRMADKRHAASNYMEQTGLMERQEAHGTLGSLGLVKSRSWTSS
jgi:hypothetical protein